MKEILRPASKLLNKTVALKDNNPMIKKSGVGTIGFGVAFWVAYYIYTTASKEN